MKKNCLKTMFLSVGLLIFGLNLLAQTTDIEINAEPEVILPGANGKLTIVITPGSGSPLFNISLSGPGSYVYTNNTASLITTISGLRSGLYCGTITENSGCVASICAKIKKCTRRTLDGKSTITCEDVIEPCCSTGEFYSTGNKINSTENDGSIGYFFNVFHQLPEDIYAEISDLTTLIMYQEINKIAQLGYSEYEILSQNEFQSEAEFIFKFNQNGTLIWVFHNFHPDLEERSPKIFTYLNSTSKLNGYIFPNPSDGLINIAFREPLDHDSVICKVFDVNGKTCFKDVIYLNNNTNASINLNDLPSGFYYMQISTPFGNLETFKIVKH